MEKSWCATEPRVDTFYETWPWCVLLLLILPLFISDVQVFKGIANTALWFLTMYSSSPKTFWMLGKIDDLISVHGLDYSVYWKNKNNRHHVCVYCYLFSLLGNMFAMCLMKLLLLLHNSCNIWFHAWCCNMKSTVQMWSWNSFTNAR